ncbi:MULTISPECIES: hypothetical protein [unclassified Variovorax]|nr:MULTISPECIES: hypothetical protein [unclassified Variovorax]SEK17401.1 hypothetical protein SAMN05518853_1513 [Variovorax sp. OK202]SFE83025.1 hypothetical protein SAMN05444746_1493 [Variovorax sp. OK212]
MRNDKQSSERRGLMKKVRLWLFRPSTIHWAFGLMKIVHWLLKAFGVI